MISSSGANVKDIQALENLLQGLQRFRERAREAERSAEIAAQTAMNDLYSRVSYWHDQVRRSQTQQESVKSQQNLQIATYWLNEVQNATNSYRKEDFILRHLIEDSQPKASAFLRKKLSELQEFLQIKSPVVQEQSTSGNFDVNVSNATSTSSEIDGRRKINRRTYYMIPLEMQKKLYWDAYANTRDAVADLPFMPIPFKKLFLAEDFITGINPRTGEKLTGRERLEVLHQEFVEIKKDMLEELIGNKIPDTFDGVIKIPRSSFLKMELSKYIQEKTKDEAIRSVIDREEEEESQ